MHTTSGYGTARYPTQRKRVVIIDDDDELSGMLRNFLEKCGWEVHLAPTGKGGLELTSQCRPDLILLDLVLPDCDGFEVLRRIRRERFTPILIISAKGEEADRIVGIELGADDYLTKPFSVRELLARMGAVLRRCSFHIGPESSESFMVGEFTVDSSKQDVKYGNDTLRLTQIEFLLLRLFLLRSYDVLSRDELIRRTMGRSAESQGRSLDMHILRLRRKLMSVHFSGTIRTIRNVGYMFVLHPGSEQN